MGVPGDVNGNGWADVIGTFPMYPEVPPRCCGCWLRSTPRITRRAFRGVLLLAAGTYLLFHLSTMYCSQPSWGYA
jgi:hypothetical protein